MNEEFNPQLNKEFHERPRSQKILVGSPDFYELKGVLLAEYEKNHPLYVTINLNTECSYGCLKCGFDHCETEGNKDDSFREELSKPQDEEKDIKPMEEPISFKERKNFLDMSRELGAKSLVIVGAGEPTENFEIVSELIEEANKEGMRTTMFTTANQMDREQAEFYRDNGATVIVSLDSINNKTYKLLTKKGDLEQVKKNIEILREVFSKTSQEIDGREIMRLGINTTVSRQNKEEIGDIKKFAGDDMFFVANMPIKQGRLENPRRWKFLVGDAYDELAEVARENSESGGHSSLKGGVCSYLNRGISLDVDGELIVCGYAAKTRGLIGNIREGISKKQILNVYKNLRKMFEKITENRESVPSCLTRDRELYNEIVEELKDKKIIEQT